MKLKKGRSMMVVLGVLLILGLYLSVFQPSGQTKSSTLVSSESGTSTSMSSSSLSSTSESSSEISTSEMSTSSTSTISPSTSSQDGNGIKFSSIIYPFTYGSNFPTSGSSFPVQVNASMQVNAIQFYLSDRAYDPYNQTVFFETSSGQVMATGTLSLWGPYGESGDEAAPVPLSTIITLQPNTPYKIAFSPPPTGDRYDGSSGVGVNQELITEAAPASGGYLGQSRWPIFTLGLMTVLPTTSGLAIHNYGSYTDLFSSAGYQGTTENAVRFLAASNEQLVSFQVEAISSVGSSDSLVFTLRADSEVGGSHPTPLANSPALATATVTAVQVKNNLTANIGSETTGQSTFIKINFLAKPQLTAGQYYWIVIASPSGDMAVTFARLVNPYRALVYNSENDFRTWGTPADGPTDLAFVVTTTSQTINNAVYGTPKNNGFSRIAQSFVPSQSTLVSGVWIEANPAGFDMNVSVQTDSGDSPSGTMLSQGNVTTPNTYGGLQGGSIYVNFSSSAELSAGTKYWLVYQVGQCLQSSCSSPNYAYVVEYLGTVAALHASLNSGSGWIAEAGQMNFVFTSPAGATSQGLSLDSSASIGCNSCLSQSLGLRVTVNDVVVVQVEMSPESVYTRVSGSSYHAGFLTSLTSPNMSFEQRFAYTSNPGSGDGSLVWEEYAIASVTANITITGDVNSSLAAWSMIGYSIKGADTAAPFDINPKLANGAYDFNDCNLFDGCRVTFSTTSADTMVLFGIGSEGNPTMLAPSGFTLIQSVIAPGWSANAVGYQLFTSPLTDASTGNWGMTDLSCTQSPSNSCGESALWYADAIVAAPVSGNSSSSTVTTSKDTNSTASFNAGSSSTTASSASPSSLPSTSSTATCSSLGLTGAIRTRGTMRVPTAETPSLGSGAPPSDCRLRV